MPGLFQEVPILKKTGPYLVPISEKSGPYLVPFRDFFLVGPNLTTLYGVKRGQKGSKVVKNGVFGDFLENIS